MFVCIRLDVGERSAWTEGAGLAASAQARRAAASLIGTGQAPTAGGERWEWDELLANFPDGAATFITLLKDPAQQQNAIVNFLSRWTRHHFEGRTRLGL